LYRFLLTTPRQLLDLQSIGMGIGDLHHLAAEETICTLSSWDQIVERNQLLMATTRGFVRAFPLSIMRESIEAAVPLRLDHPLSGLPILTCGANQADEYVLATAGGRGLRGQVTALRTGGVQVMNCGKDDILAAAALTHAGEELLLLTSNGYGRRLQAAHVYLADKPNHKGYSLIARRDPVAALARGGNWIVSKHKIRPLRLQQLKREDSTRSSLVFKDMDSDQVCCALAVPVK
jgi:DNA gyrase/topoisomerase IV subunit A